MGADSVARIPLRVKAIASLAKELERLPGLAEADRLGLRIVREILGEALSNLAEHRSLSPSQAEHLHQSGEALFGAADALPHAPSPAQIALWRDGLEPAVKAFALAVHELPHR